MDLDSKKSKKFGETTFGELTSESAHDFEDSFTQYFLTGEKNYYKELGTDFTDVKFGEIDNSEIKDYKQSFKNYFT